MCSSRSAVAVSLVQCLVPACCVRLVVVPHAVAASLALFCLCTMPVTMPGGVQCQLQDIRRMWPTLIKCFMLPHTFLVLYYAITFLYYPTYTYAPPHTPLARSCQACSPPPADPPCAVVTAVLYGRATGSRQC